MVSTSPIKGKTRQLSTWEHLESKRPLPVKFVLYPSRRTNRLLCPCLVVDYCNVNIIRILDPDHRQPYISLDSIFLLVGKSITLGILEFGLDRNAGDYDLTLAGLEPREALWVPLKVARRVAEEVGLLELLSTLLDWDNRHIWTLDEGDEGLIHNWRTVQIDAAAYSTGALVETSIKGISLLPKGQQVRTLISTELRQELQEQFICLASSSSKRALQSIRSRSRFEQRMLRWSVLACEELQRADSKSGEDDDDDDGDRFMIDHSELLLLFQDYVDSLGLDTKLELVSLDADEMLTSKRQACKDLQKTQEELYRMARVNVTLLHHLWTLYRNQIAEESANHEEAPGWTPDTEIKGQDQLKLQLKSLEEHSKRTEVALSELLSRKTDLNQNGNISNRSERWRDLTDVRLLVVFIFGILLGSAAMRS